MKKRWNKLMALALTGVMGSALLAGCGGSASTDSSDDSSASTGSDTKAEAKNDGKTHIEFFNQKTEIVDILNELFAEYEEANPDIKIDLVTPADASTVLSSRM